MQADYPAEHDTAHAWLQAIRCPFCDKTGLEAKEVRTCNPSGQGQDGAAAPGPSGQVVYELGLYCAKCQRAFRQTRREGLLPESIMDAD